MPPGTMSREAGCDDLVVVPMRFPDFRRRQPRRIGAAARAVAERTPGTLSLVPHRAQPPAVPVARLAATAVFAYLVALPLPVTPRPVLAPLTALLVAQVSLYQTLRSAVQRVAAVVAGVLLRWACRHWSASPGGAGGSPSWSRCSSATRCAWATPSSRSPSARC